MARYGISRPTCSATADCKSTGCPGKNFPWPELRMKLRAPATQRVAVAPGPGCCATHDAPASEIATRLAGVKAPAAPAAAALPTGAGALPLPPRFPLPPSGALPPQAR